MGGSESKARAEPAAVNFERAGASLIRKVAGLGGLCRNPGDSFPVLCCTWLRDDLKKGEKNLEEKKKMDSRGEEEENPKDRKKKENGKKVNAGGGRLGERIKPTTWRGEGNSPRV